MANQRSTFAKRQREQNRDDKARAKQARLAARRSGAAPTKGPPIAPFELVGDLPGDAQLHPVAATDDAPGD